MYSMMFPLAWEDILLSRSYNKHNNRHVLALVLIGIFCTHKNTDKHQ
jgi:hypothetical protein